MKRIRDNVVRLYQKFHGKLPRKEIFFPWHPPKRMVMLGRCVAVIYESNKIHGGGDGKPAQYIHEFESPVILCMDERAKKQLYILGNRVKVTEHGIEN